MPTLVQIKEALRSNNIPYKSNMKKEHLLELLGRDKYEALDYIHEVSVDLMNKGVKGVILDGEKFLKVCEVKTKTSYVATLTTKNKKRAILVQGSYSPGLGKSGGKWVIDYESI